MTGKPDNYTDEQRALVMAAGSVFAEACPGAGKTRAIVARFIRRAREERRKGIALLSFTNVAVDEVRSRCGDQADLLGPPHFVGTFDGFINRYITAPSYVATYGRAPQGYVESWSAISGTQVRCAEHPAKSFELEWFSFDMQGAATLEASRIAGKYQAALLSEADACRLRLERRAAQLYRKLVRSGVLSSSASRWFARAQICEDSTAGRLGGLLGNRFAEVIVDEAQDCGPEELAVLELLQKSGVDVVLVGDLDQSIYEFRRANPLGVKKFVVGDPLRLTGNFRSSPAICRVNDSLRVGASRDEAMGRHKDIQYPVQLLQMSDRESTAKMIVRVAGDYGFTIDDIMVLSYRNSDSASAAGIDRGDGIGNSNVAQVASARLMLKTEADLRQRKRAIEAVERVVLKALGLSDDSASIDSVCANTSLDRRWLADVALRLALSVDPQALSAGDYARSLRVFLGGLVWPTSHQLAPLGQVLRAPQDGQWRNLSPISRDLSLSWSSVHAAKGKEFPVVALVVPKNQAADSAGKTALDHWEAGTAAEVRRVMYVGASRAEQLLMFVVHGDHLDRYAAQLAADGLAVRIWTPEASSK